MSFVKVHMVVLASAAHTLKKVHMVILNVQAGLRFNCVSRCFLISETKTITWTGLVHLILAITLWGTAGSIPIFR